MTLAFVAFSDPHVGRSWGAHTVPSCRQALTDAYLDPIHELIKAYPDTPKVCGGDWYDRAHNDERTIQTTLPMLQEMAMVVAGNHDHVNRAGAVTTLGLQDRVMLEFGQTPISMNHEHLDRPLVELATFSGVNLLAVPHHATQELFEQALLEAEEAAKQLPGPKVLLTHCNLGSLGEGKPDSNLYLTPPLRELLEKTFDFILVGHEHLPRQVGKTIVMGSTQPCNFGELGPRFFYEFHVKQGQLTVERVPIQTQLTHVTYDIVELMKMESWKGAKLVDLQGVMPIAQARNVQRVVKDFFDTGALAVRMGVAFDKGNTLDGDAVSSSMSNLVDVVRHEISDNEQWTALLDETLAELNEEN